MNPFNASTPCPLCKSIQRLPLASQRVLDLDASGAETILGEQTLHYLSCPRCHTVSVDPVPDQARLDTYYAAIPLEVDSHQQRVDMARLYLARIALLRRVTDLQRGTCLDVGAGRGGFLASITENWGLQAWGIEPSQDAGNRKNGKVIRHTLADLEPGADGLPETFELVSCCHVLEHVADPCSFLDQLTRRVARNGWLYLEVPSSELLARDVDSVSGQNIYPLHLHHFLGSGLASALEERGLRTVYLADRQAGDRTVLALVAVRDDPDRSGGLFRRQLERQGDRSRLAANNLAEIAAEVGNQGKRVLVWGAGVDIFDLLVQGNDPWPRNCDLFDRNPDKQGKTLAGVPILRENDLAASKHVVILAGTRHRALAEMILADARTLLPEAQTGFLFEPGEVMDP